MDLVSKVMVMNKKTWKVMLSELIDSALEKEDPIGYIMGFRMISIILNEDIKGEFVEIYDRDTYEQFKKRNGDIKL